MTTENTTPMTWRPIEDAPRDGTWILTISKNGGRNWTIPDRMRWHQGRWDIGYEGFMVYHPPLFWMPLPEPPHAA